MGMERKEKRIFGIIEEVLIDSEGNLLLMNEEVSPYEEVPVVPPVEQETQVEDAVQDDSPIEEAEVIEEEIQEEVQEEEIQEEIQEEVSEETQEEIQEEIQEEVSEEIQEEVSEEPQKTEDEVFFVYQEVNEEEDPDSLAAYKRKAARILEEETSASAAFSFVEWPETIVKPKPVAKTFAQKMAIADESIQDRYDQLKNYALRFKKLKARISRKFDSINKGRLQFVKLSVAGKTLKLFLNMDIGLADPKFHCKDVADKKTYVTVPVLLRIKSGRAVKYAKTLIDKCAEQHGLVENKKFREVDAMALIDEACAPKRSNSKAVEVAVTETNDND